jgi:hypothetical protein
VPSRALRTAALALLVSFGFVEAAAAYYSPRLGRFLNRDPIGEAGAVLLQRVAAKTAFVPPAVCVREECSNAVRGPVWPEEM